EKAQLAPHAQQIAAIPGNSALATIFSDDAAWRAILNDPRVYKGDFIEQTKPLAGAIDDARNAIDATNTALIAFDQAVVDAGALPSGCLDDLKRLQDHRNTIRDIALELGGADSPLHATMKVFDDTTTLWKGYRQSLTGDWTAEAIEVVVSDPLQADSVL